MLKTYLTFVLILGFYTTIIAQSIPVPSVSQKEIAIPDNYWILKVVDSMRYQSSICESCDSPPTFKRYEDEKGTIYYRIRYTCDKFTSVTRIYDEKGILIGKCQVSPVQDQCEDFDAYTAFTYSDKKLDIWSCEKGFNCIAKDSLGLYKAYEFRVDGSACTDATRRISLTTSYPKYKWEGELGDIGFRSSIQAIATGTYSVSVTDYDNCTFTNSLNISVNDRPELRIQGSTVLCQGESTYLSVSQKYQHYQWSTGDSKNSISSKDVGLFSLKATTEDGCVDSSQIFVERLENRDISIIIPSDPVYKNQVVPLKLSFENIESDQISDIFWHSSAELSCDNCLTPFGKILEEAEIFVSIEDEFGCLYERTAVISPLEAYKDVYTANVFNPDSDENSYFAPQSLKSAATVHNFRIFNRWGVVVFEAERHEINDESMAWRGTDQNGTPLPADIYVYVADLEFRDGSSRQMRGDILLVR